uniref:Uncharacterized protein n=1 Tax=Meloidogyne enterolobii TaxID=390850 RepID=A0A6V7W7Z0_MELEN|nr:unnamed protein product [Meloidogyne enterolobii]
MSENLQGVNDDLVSTLCSCSTINFEDSLNRIKLLEVEKDKTNLAFQLILAKLDLGLYHDQTIIKQLQELNEKMGGNEKIFSLQKMQFECFENKNKLEIEVEKQKEEIKSLESDKLEKEVIKILNENLEENKNELDEYKNKMAKLEEERYLVENELFKFKADFEKLKEENEKIFEEKLELLKELEENKLKIEKYEEDKKLELINLAKLKKENEGIFKVKNKLLEENKIKIMKIEEENKKLTKKLKDSENSIFPLRHEISQNKRNYEQAIKQVKDLAEDRDGQIKTLTERNAAYSDAKYEAEKKAKELLAKNEQLQLENKDFIAKIQLKDEKIRSFEMQVKEKCLNLTAIKFVELTSELDKLNKENKQIFYVKKPNKMSTIKNENSCCENKCINSNLCTGDCDKGNGYVNVYLNGMIKYRNKMPNDLGILRENKWIFLYGQHPYSKLSGYDSNYSLFYFEVKIFKELDSKICYAGIGFDVQNTNIFLCNYSIILGEIIKNLNG